ncbi:MAG: efflux RND transporter periplasmic adaptor subunit [Alphaproteobacteria bacterium]|nr:efflux RND transporter periplasmic adaptor subunit [Alphaproteobacteria bacterium]
MAVVAVAAASGGWWAGRKEASAPPPPPPPPQAEAGHGAEETARRIVYYRNPMGLPDTSPVPKKDSMGMDYVPVYADEVVQSPPRPAPPQPAARDDGRRILYYRNPMGLPDTSPVPKKDSMGMDYVPVYEDEAGVSAAGPATLKIAPDRVQMLGVKTEAAALRSLNRVVRAVGSVQADERRLAVVAPKFEAWIETLNVDTTGATVRRGQPLMQVYSPELVLAQQEYLVTWTSQQSLKDADPRARQASTALAEGALQRLRNFDIDGAQLDRLRREGKAARTLTLTSPADGVVLEKTAVRGMRFMPGETLYRIADLSSVWVIADVFEQDLGLIQPGQEVHVAVNAYPGRSFAGKVGFIYPALNAETRTAKVRIEIPNPEGLLRLALYATVEFTAPMAAEQVLTVPESAVIDSGKRQVVLVERGEGGYEPRPVKIGARAEGYAHVLEGVADGERVVVRANFLIDAESNLRAALGAFTQGQSGETRRP